MNTNKTPPISSSIKEFNFIMLIIDNDNTDANTDEKAINKVDL